MKNFSLFLALFCAMFFAVACDSGIKFMNPDDIHSPAYQGDKDDENEDEDEPLTRTETCSSKPDNSVWNTVGTITQTYTENGWEPSTTPVYSEIPSESECRFKCYEGYNWDGYSCTNNSSAMLPECSKYSGTPCYDSSSGLTWSAKSSNSLNRNDAVSYCTSYSEGGLSGWRLPNIDELKTLITAPSGTPRTKNCAVSEVNNCLSYSGCWECLTCTEQGIPLNNNTSCGLGNSYSDGRFSKLGDGNRLWSSSIQSDQSNRVWGVDFGIGYVKSDGYTPDNFLIYHARCVR